MSRSRSRIFRGYPRVAEQKSDDARPRTRHAPATRFRLAIILVSSHAVCQCEPVPDSSDYETFFDRRADRSCPCGETPRIAVAGTPMRDRRLRMVPNCNGRRHSELTTQVDCQRGWINHLAVDPELRSAGVGRLLTERAEQRLDQVGCLVHGPHVVCCQLPDTAPEPLRFDRTELFDKDPPRLSRDRDHRTERSRTCTRRRRRYDNHRPSEHRVNLHDHAETLTLLLVSDTLSGHPFRRGRQRSTDCGGPTQTSRFQNSERALGVIVESNRDRLRHDSNIAECDANHKRSNDPFT